MFLPFPVHVQPAILRIWQEAHEMWLCTPEGTDVCPVLYVYVFLQMLYWIVNIINYPLEKVDASLVKLP